MNTQLKSLHEITQEAIQILSKEMGIADTIRFLNQFSQGYGDYTQERDAMFQDLTLDDILRQMDQSE
jgi:hypothetical protein